MRRPTATMTIFALIISVLLPGLLLARSKDFTLIDIQKLNRYDEDRILYQHFEKPHNEFSPDAKDNSIAALMVIKDKNVYLFKDGYDDHEAVLANRLLHDRGNQFLPDLWTNKIESVPNFVTITDRKIELQKNTSKEFVATNYKDFYVDVRDRFLKKHAAIFLSLIVNRKDIEIAVERKRIPRKIYEGDAVKYSTWVSARTSDGGTVYYAEDADGDGVTETFMVHSSDGFQWGFKTGPNLINIQNNTRKEIEAIIGWLVTTAYSGSPVEDELIKKTFPTTSTVGEMIDDIYYIDSETRTFMKKKNIDLEAEVDKKAQVK